MLVPIAFIKFAAVCNYLNSTQSVEEQKIKIFKAK